MIGGCDIVPVNVLDVPIPSLLWPATGIYSINVKAFVGGGTQVAR
jgi:hypothetical protein